MSGPAKQFAFVDGHWVDQWNDGLDDTMPRPDFTGSWPEVILPICGCGNPEMVMRAMMEYMTRVAAWHDAVSRSDLPVAGSPQVREGNLADLLLAYLADEADLTEHGGSVNWSWPTDGGRRWMELAYAEITERDGT